MNYFELFNLPIGLVIDRSTLSKRYFELQKVFHPDYFTMEDEAAQEAALEKTAALNKAFKILKDKNATIEYLLQLKGQIVTGEKHVLPPDFLMEMMELNEDLSKDSDKEIALLEVGIYEPVKAIIANYDDAKVTNNDLVALKDYYYKKKYLQRILDRMNG